jgi:hypothetical protein
LEEAKIITLPKPVEDRTLPQNLLPISLLPKTAKLFEKVILNVVQRHIGERGLLNASQFGIHSSHNMTLKCMRLTNNVTLNCNTSTTAVFLDIKKAFDTTWRTGMLYMLSKIFSFQEEILYLGGRRNVYAKDNASQGATRICLVPFSV